MSSFIIKTGKPQTLYLANHFYILNKGLNSGKPLNEPCPNCFVVIFEETVDRDAYYWLAYSLWKANYWRQFLIGSVIPFLRINDFKVNYQSRSIQMLQEHESHVRNIKALKLLQQKEFDFIKKLKLIGELRNTILTSYCRPIK